MSDWKYEQAMEYVRLSRHVDNREFKEWMRHKPDGWKTMVKDELKRLDLYDHVPIKRLKLKDTP